MIGNQVLFCHFAIGRGLNPPFNENNRANFNLLGVYFLTQPSSSSNLKVSIKLVNGLKFENPVVKVGSPTHRPS